jgi:L-rhamnose-H+ transport protein
MMMNPTLGFVLMIAAGVMNGSYALPTKKTTKWAFENTWLVFSVVAMLVVNWGIAASTVPNLAQVYAKAGANAIWMVFGFGMIWGLANVLFGIGLYWIGMSLTFPIAIGLSTALGSLIPMVPRPGVFLTPAGAAISLGVAVLLAGVAMCGLAGVRKDAQSRQGTAPDAAQSSPATHRRLLKGILVVVLSGLCDPFLNFAFTFGDTIKQEALAAGAAHGGESDAIWALALSGSCVVNAIYCAVLLTRNGTWSRFHEASTRHYWPLAALMGVVWMLSITCYGRGAAAMGPLGGSVGWAMFYGCIILVSMFWGVVFGEWKEARGGPLRTLCGGLALLMIALVVLGYSNTLPMPRTEP